MKTDNTTAQRMNSKMTLLHSLYIILTEFRAYSKDESVREISDLFHNVPLMLMEDEDGTETMGFFKEKLLNSNYSTGTINKYKNLTND